MKLRYRMAALLAGWAMLSTPAQAIVIELDYSYDTTGYFTPAMRDLLGEAASLFERNLLNQFAPANISVAKPDGSFTRTALGADTIRIYLGTNNFTDGTLGTGTVGTAPRQGRPAGGSIIVDTLNDMPVATPYWDGTVHTAPAPRPWYLDDDITTREPSPTHLIYLDNAKDVSITTKDLDFYTLALHEMGHILGLGHVSQSLVSTAYGVPQTSVMTPIADGERHYFTEYDWQSLAALGWQVASLDPALVASAVPETSNWAMLLGGIGMLGVVRRRQARKA